MSKYSDPDHAIALYSNEIWEKIGSRALSQDLHGLMIQIGAESHPRVCPGLVTSSNMTFGLYSSRQAKRQGRGRMTEDMVRVGGLVAPAGTPPAHGTVEVFDTLPAGLPAPAPFPGAQAPVQCLRTDGDTWLALVPAGGDTWEVREWLKREGPPADSGRTTPFETIRWIEFLRRAVLSWAQRDNPEILALYLASFAREEIERRLRQDRKSVELFGETLKRTVGLKIGPSRDHRHDRRRPTAEMLVACSMLELVKARLPNVAKNKEDWGSEPLRRLLSWPTMSPALERILAIVPTLWEAPTTGNKAGSTEELMAKHAAAVDRRLVRFCMAFWKSLSGAARRREGFDAEHAYSVDEQARDLLSAGACSPGYTLTLMDPNAGIGDHLVAAARQIPETIKHPVFIACEANPFGLQIVLLRLAVLADRLARAGAEPYVAVHLYNTFRDGWPKKALTVPADLLIGEWRPHIGQTMSLDLGSGEARHGWGAKIEEGDSAVDRCLEATRTALDTGGVRLASLRVPAPWADGWGEGSPSVRKRLAQETGEMLVNTTGLKERPSDRRAVWGDVTLLLSPSRGRAAVIPEGYQPIAPRAETGFSFLPEVAMPDDAYARWLSLRDLAARPPMNGPIERRGLGLIDIDPKRLEERLHIYFGDASDEDVRRCCRALMENEKRKNFDPVKTRRELRGQTTFRQERMASFSFRPFDDRYLYSYRLKPLFGEPAEALFELAERDNFFLVASTGMAKSDGGAPAWFGRLPCDSDFFAGHIGHIPAWLEALEPNGARRANLSSAMRSYLTWLGFGDPDLSRDAALILWHHALAVLYAPAYQDKHAELLRHGYPRLPLPGHTDNRSPASARKILEASADLGQQIADLLEPRCHPGKPELADMAILIVDGHAADPHELRPEDLTVTANWGTLAKWGAVRPRKGVTTAHGTDQRIDSNHWRNHFEGPAVDVHLNDHAYWSGIPNAVWEYRIGGRQVLAKWLSYRQEYDPVKSDTLPILGRPLTPDEAGHFTDTARRLARLILLGRELDRSWERLRDA